jgi:hypothetical protein
LGGCGRLEVRFGDGVFNFGGQGEAWVRGRAVRLVWSWRWKRVVGVDEEGRTGPVRGVLPHFAD